MLDPLSKHNPALVCNDSIKTPTDAPSWHGRLLQALILVCILAAWATVFHDFAGYVHRAPPFENDDTLANISHNFSTQLILGDSKQLILEFLDSGILTTEKNYSIHGPWYYLAGALLDWIFQAGHGVLRSIHPLGLAVASIIAWGAFRAVSLSAAMLASGLFILLFQQLHWPMVRPDILVALFGIATMVSASSAWRHPRPWSWWGLGAFFALSAFFTHMIGWAVSPLFGILWLLWCFLGSPNTRKPWRNPVVIRSLAAILLGILAAIAIFVSMRGSHDFAEQWRIWIGSLSSASKGEDYHLNQQVSYLAMLHRHQEFIFANATWLKRMTFAAYACAFALSLIPLWRPFAARAASVHALILPPLILGAGFHLLLPFYPNTHAGYALFPQIAAAWTAAAVVAAAFSLLPWPLAARRLDAAFAVLGFIAMAVSSMHSTLFSSPWRAKADMWSSHQDYAERLAAPLPDGARVIASFITYAQAPIRLNLAGEINALKLFRSLADHLKPAALPDALILSPRLDRARFLQTLFPSSCFPRNKGEAFPDMLPALVQTMASMQPVPGIFQPVQFVHGPPYGTSITYARMAEDATLQPAVAVNLGGDDLWGTALSPPMPVQLQAVPIRIDFFSEEGQSCEPSTVLAHTISLPQGQYFLSLKINNPSPNHYGILWADPRDHLRLTGFNKPGWLNQDDLPQITYYFPGAKRAFMLLNHSGGPLNIGMLDHNADASFQISSLQNVVVPEPWAPLPTSIPMPTWNQWTTAAPAVSTQALPSGHLALRTDSSPQGYQLLSPLLNIPPQQDFVLRIDGHDSAERVRFGVLSPDGSQWLASGAKLGENLPFHSGPWKQVSLVLLNHQTQNPVPADVELSGAQLRQLNHDHAVARTTPLPDFGLWSAADQNVRLQPQLQEGSFILHTNLNPSGYQLISPPIPVQPHDRIRVLVQGRTLRGRLSIGVLSADQSRWLSHGHSTGQRFFTDIDDSHQVFLVIANNQPESPSQPGQLLLQGGSISSTRFLDRYADILLACVNHERHDDRSFCVPDAFGDANMGRLHGPRGSLPWSADP